MDWKEFIEEMTIGEMEELIFNVKDEIRKRCEDVAKIYEEKLFALLKEMADRNYFLKTHYDCEEGTILDKEAIYIEFDNDEDIKLCVFE